MSEAVPVLSLMMMTLTDFEESLAMDIHTDRYTHRQAFASSILNFFKIVSDFDKKKKNLRMQRGFDQTRIRMGFRSNL